MITEAAIKAAMKRVAKGKTVELKDDGNRGEGRLALKIRGRESGFLCEWYAVWWRDEKRKSGKIGLYPQLSISDARKAFRESCAPAISAGKDPEFQRARKDKSGVTVEDLFRGYVESLRAAGKPSWEFAERALLGAGELAVDPSERKKGKKSKPGEKRRYEHAPAVEAIGRAKRAADVVPADLRSFLADIYDRDAHVMADKSRTYLHAAFNWAIKSANSYTSAVGRVDWGILHNPVTAIPADAEANKAGDRHLTPAEFRAFWHWLGDRKSVVAPAARLIMATGQRVEEILQLNRAAYAEADCMLDWSKTKNGTPHAIPLSDRAKEVLEAVPHNTFGVYFPHLKRPRENATVGTLEKLCRTFCEDSGAPHFTPRDLRRTWKTLAGAAGLSKEVRDRLQNHARGDVSSKHYDRYDYLAEKRAAVETWGAYMELILSGELDNPVVRLRA